MTPEEIKQIQQSLAIGQLEGIYDTESKRIIARIGQAYEAMRDAVAGYEVLAQRVAAGDMTAIASRHAVRKSAMAGQDEVIQATFIGTMATLEEAQAIVYQVTGGGRFLPIVPLPEVEEVEE